MYVYTYNVYNILFIENALKIRQIPYVVVVSMYSGMRCCYDLCGSRRFLHCEGSIDINKISIENILKSISHMYCVII